MRRIVAAFLVLNSATGAVAAQAPPNPTSAQIGYGSLKNRVQPQGELAAQIAAIDSGIALANRRGQTAEVRRLIAKGTALLNNRPWTDEDDFRQSLSVRSEQLFVDPSRPYRVRLEQTFSPTLALSTSASARASIRPAAGGEAAAQSRPLGEFTDIGRDLRDAPLRMDLDLSSVADGPYLIDVDVLDGGRSVGRASLRITVLRGFRERLAALDAVAASAPPAVRADLLFPSDYVRKIERGLIEIGRFNHADDVTAAEDVAAAVKAGKDPFAGKTGGFERHYVLESAGEIMPYRVFVPSTFVRGKRMPLLIALHGAGGTEDGFMDGYDGQLPVLAEKHGYIVASPLGYRPTGGYGSPIMARGRMSELSEQDVMQVLARMRQDYPIDERRIYLMGHSMGAIGSWYLGSKYPDLWAGLGMFAGLGDPATETRMKAIPQFVVHGDADFTVLVARSRVMVAEMKKLGVDHQYIEVPGGTHVNIVTPNLPAMFEFFAAHRRRW
jgi:predicted esterase